MSRDIVQSEGRESPPNTLQSISDTMDLSGIKKLPAELYNRIIELWMSTRDPFLRAHILTMVNKRLRGQWGPALCRTVGPLRVDEHLDPQVLRFLGQDKHKSATDSLSIYYNTSINRTPKATAELHQNLINLAHTYDRAQNLRTLVVHPENMVDPYFQPHYQHLAMGLSKLRTLVVPAVQSGPGGSLSWTMQSQVGVIVRTHHNSETEENTVFLRHQGFLNTARYFMTRPGYSVDHISLFGYDDEFPNWRRSYDHNVDAREVNLHTYLDWEFQYLRLSKNVVSLSICNPLSRFQTLQEDVMIFSARTFRAQKQKDGNLDLHQLHLISTVSWSRKQRSWISAWMLGVVMSNMLNLSALSLHHRELMPIDDWSWASGQSPNMKFFSVRDSKPLIYTDIQDIAHGFPNLEGLALDIPRFEVLHGTGEYTDDHRKMFIERGSELWDALSNFHLKKLLLFVPRPKKVWMSEEIQQHAKLFEFALLDFLSSLEDESLQTVHFVLRDLGYTWSEEKSNPRDEIVWSFRVRFDTTTEPNGFVNPSEASIDPLAQAEMTEDESKAFKTLIGHQEMTMEKIEQKELGHLYYSPKKLSAVRKEEEANANAELAKEAAGEEDKLGNKRRADAGLDGGGQAKKTKS